MSHHFNLLEPISKSPEDPEEDNEAGELNKAKEVLAVVLPTDEALDEPSSHITAYNLINLNDYAVGRQRDRRDDAVVARGGSNVEVPIAV